MNTLLISIMLVGAPLGPSGAPQTEPFQLNAAYQADYAEAETCSLHPSEADSVKIGKKAVYEVQGGTVTVLLDEFARRFALDYCWQADSK